MKINWQMNVIGYSEFTQTIGVEYSSGPVKITKTFDIPNDSDIDVKQMIEDGAPIDALKKASELTKLKNIGSFNTEDDNKQGELLLG